MPRLKPNQQRQRTRLITLRQAFNTQGVLIPNLFQLGSLYYWHDEPDNLELLGEMTNIVYRNWQKRRDEQKLGLWDGDFVLSSRID